ncbi:MAG: type IV toxin-antitoxin system AbiEi family antitoxin domain-containing protein [Pseudonocardiales bacterium]
MSAWATDARLDTWLGWAARVVTRADAIRCGLGPAGISYRVRVGRWLRLAPEVYLTCLPATQADYRRAAVLHAGGDAVLSGTAALSMLGFRVPQPVSELVLVSADCHAASWGRIRVRKTHRLPRARPCAGVPRAPVARAVADHAIGLAPLQRVQAVVGYAVQQGLCTVAELATELEVGPRRGSHFFREALLDVGYGAHSPAEALAGRALRQGGVVHLEQNAEVRCGTRRLVADFLDRDRRAILEVDSTQYHFSQADQDATLLRDQRLQAAGYAVMHVKPRQIRADPDGFVRIVVDWLAALDVRSTG